MGDEYMVKEEVKELVVNDDGDNTSEYSMQEQNDEEN